MKMPADITLRSSRGRPFTVMRDIDSDTELHLSAYHNPLEPLPVVDYHDIGVKIFSPQMPPRHGPI